MQIQATNGSSWGCPIHNQQQMPTNPQNTQHQQANIRGQDSRVKQS